MSAKKPITDPSKLKPGRVLKPNVPAAIGKGWYVLFPTDPSVKADKFNLSFDASAPSRGVQIIEDFSEPGGWAVIENGKRLKGKKRDAVFLRVMGPWISRGGKYLPHTKGAGKKWVDPT